MHALSGSLMYKYTNYPVLMSYNNDLLYNTTVSYYGAILIDNNVVTMQLASSPGSPWVWLDHAMHYGIVTKSKV